MKLAILKERRNDESRVSMTPSIAGSIIKMGFEVFVESGAGLSANFTDESYTQTGATVQSFDQLKGCDAFVYINIPTEDFIDSLPDDIFWISSIYHRTNAEVVAKMNSKKWNAISLDAIPRISRAQSMDILSSQANLAGYRAVIEGAYYLDKIFPMLMTAAGTITPSKVLVFGAGVAGLQAIATAKRLGAVVEATDVRPETKEQVESLGGKFIEVKGASVESEGGYAKEASEEYRKLQREAVNKSLSQADLVITTALVPGRKAPILIDEEQLALMKRGSVLVDMAAEQGGNCAKTEANKVTEVNGVRIIGSVNLPATLSTNASDLFARNIWELLKLIGKDGKITLDMEDEIIQGSLICSNGTIHKLES